jgi:hypothetical protein
LEKPPQSLHPPADVEDGQGINRPVAFFKLVLVDFGLLFQVEFLFGRPQRLQGPHGHASRLLCGDLALDLGQPRRFVILCNETNAACICDPEILQARCG